MPGAIEAQIIPRWRGTATVTTRPATVTLRAALLPTSTDVALIEAGTRIFRGNVTTSEPPTRRPHCSSVRSEGGGRSHEREDDGESGRESDGTHMCMVPREQRVKQKFRKLREAKTTSPKLPRVVFH